MVDKKQLFFSTFTNKKGINKMTASFTLEFAEKLANLEEETFRGFIDELKAEIQKINN
ncbi:hypothetical protein OAQ50_03040 [Acidimicrobiia bacterium]|mgnify:CR=1 FL=1|jgi:hypothetical protein|nr:hypothetical protein [Acidimicrobiia bacterium]